MSTIGDLNSFRRYAVDVIPTGTGAGRRSEHDQNMYVTIIQDLLSVTRLEGMDEILNAQVKTETISQCSLPLLRQDRNVSL